MRPSASPPAVTTRPSGMRMAVEWYMRGSDSELTTVHSPVAGSQISHGSTAFVSLSASPVPPTARHLPSARITRFSRRRAKFRESVSFHWGEAVVMSSTDDRAMAGSSPPARRIFPGAYMTEDSEYPEVEYRFEGPEVQLPVPFMLRN